MKDSTLMLEIKAHMSVVIVVIPAIDCHFHRCPTPEILDTFKCVLDSNSMLKHVKHL